MNNNKQPRQLAEEHWDWLQPILNKQREMEKKLFLDAFIHGYEHGEKDSQKEDTGEKVE